MGVASQEGYKERRDEGKGSALRKAGTHGERERLLERQLQKSKQRGRKEWGEWKPVGERETHGWVDPWTGHMDVSGHGGVGACSSQVAVGLLAGSVGPRLRPQPSVSP